MSSMPTLQMAAALNFVAIYKALGGRWEMFDELPPDPQVRPRCRRRHPASCVSVTRAPSHRPRPQSGNDGA